MTKSDKEFVADLKRVKMKLKLRIGKICPELHSNCFGCKTHIAIGVINEWIDLID